MRTRWPFLVLWFLVLPFSFTCAFHHVISGRFPHVPLVQRSQLARWASREEHDTAASTLRSPPATNSSLSTRDTTARDFLTFLQRRYAEESSYSGGELSTSEKKEWKKTQMYLYRSHHLLSWEKVEAVVEFLDSRVPTKTSKKVLQQTPRILRKSVQSFLTPTADFLLDLWGTEVFAIAVEQNPKLLLARGVGYSSRADQGDKDVIEVLTLAGLSMSAIEKLKKTAPYVFGLSSRKVQSFVDFLFGLLEGGELAPLSYKHNEAQVANAKKISAQIITTHPYLLNLCIEDNLKARVAFIKKYCHMSDVDIAKMVQTSKGTVLNLAVEKNLKPTLEYITQVLSIEDEPCSPVVLRKSLLTHPQVLTLSLGNLRAKVEYFSQLDGRPGGGDGLSLAGRILSRCPTVYSLSLEGNIIPKVRTLAKAWGVSGNTDHSVGKANASLSKMLQEFPNILTSSLEGNILPTLNFFNRTGYTTLTDTWELEAGATRIPGRHLGASLYNRLLPRWHYCLSQGTTVVEASDGKNQSSESLIPIKSPSLHVLVLANDAKFCESLALDLKEYLIFKENASPRLKFSSQFDTWIKTGRPIEV